MKELDFLNILVVEDDENSLLYLLFALEARNCNVYKAGNGLEALKLVKESQIQFDLVLMDLKLPIMDGFTATEEIKKIQPNIPVIAQTAIYLYTESEKLIDSKIDAVLMKPYSISALIDAIQSVIKLKKDSPIEANQNSLLLLQ